MRAFSPLTVILLLVALIAPLSGASAANIAYHNKEYGWTIAYPDDWMVIERKSAFVALMPPDSMPGVVTISSARADFGSLEELADNVDVVRIATFAQRHLTYTVLSRTHGALADGTPYIETEYRTSNTNEALHWRERSFLLRSTAFVLVADTFTDMWVVLDPAFEAILDTFEPNGALAFAAGQCAPRGTLCGAPLQWIGVDQLARHATALQARTVPNISPSSP